MKVVSVSLGFYNKNAMDWDAYKQQKCIAQGSGSSSTVGQLGWIWWEPLLGDRLLTSYHILNVSESREKQVLFDSLNVLISFIRIYP